ncbi:hypothetical protein PPYR_11065 [Photinus pyralis]|uniref:Uncharacterized protein n=1 Tax=Photinus pyralis TaxID=7054 RepID=A0A5N4AI62_PHOPY|nr:general odorant-binding protein 57c-like [Photinus pyralis]KAB0797004.1 hypothetical protein PPYR_11065 [Photinus pyralis]
MRVVLLLICCITAIIAVQKMPLEIRQAWLKAAEPDFSVCVASSGVDSIVAYNAIAKNEIPNDSALKCFLNCIQQRANLMNSVGELLEDEFVRVLKGVTPAIAKKCVAQTQNETDICKKSFEMFLCMVYALGKPYPPLTH